MAKIDVVSAPKGFGVELFDGFNPFAILVTGLGTSVISLQSSGYRVYLEGNFTFDADQQLTGGTVTSAHVYLDLHNARVIASQISMPIVSMVNTLATHGLRGVYEQLLTGADEITGSANSDLGDVINGYGGNDTLRGVNGNDTIFGGAGDDKIFGPNNLSGVTRSYLRGDDGDDVIAGAAGFDDINGNKGSDTCNGGQGADWVVGGQGADTLYGDAGNDIVYGNIGADACYGGAGDDIVRGGQDDDLVYGEDGNDWLSGDRASDTITGGGGADIFYGFSGTALDYVTDFSIVQGDRIQLAPGSTYALRQDGANAVIDLGQGDQIVLADIQASSLTGNWLFFG